MKTKIYTLTTDTDGGTDTSVFATRDERDAAAWGFIMSYDPQKDLRAIYDNPLDAWAEIQENTASIIDSMILDDHEIDLPTEPVNAGLLLAAKQSLMYIPDSTMFYSEGDHGDRVYLKDVLTSAIAAAESPALADTARPKVVIEVSGGVAAITACPPGVDVEIIDHDNLEADLDKAKQKADSQ